MQCRAVFADNSYAWLCHHGVKGMHWGEWNEETKERYGIRDDDGGLSKLKAFRETSYVLPKDRSIERYASLKESRKGTDLSKPFYAISNEYDHNQYGQYLDDLPSAHETGLFGRVPSKMGLVRMSTVDDMTVARGSFVMEQLMGEQPKYATPGNPYHTFDTGSDDWRKGDQERAEIHAVAKAKLQDPSTLDRFRKMGYDAIEDIEDQTIPTGRGYTPTHPLIVLNGDRVAINKVDKFKKDKPPSWD